MLDILLQMRLIVFFAFCLLLTLFLILKLYAIYFKKKNANNVYVIIKKNGKVIKRGFMTDEQYTNEITLMNSKRTNNDYFEIITEEQD
ncbi:MAG: hypothetical protein NC485_10330 [Ruminococcus flavefaciens]|nr:hypothetical protein [Ruminococcus flavefaciens]MCM1059294.1 hypothetical protein [Eubacterium sp.]